MCNHDCHDFDLLPDDTTPAEIDRANRWAAANGVAYAWSACCCGETYNGPDYSRVYFHVESFITNPKNQRPDLLEDCYVRMGTDSPCPDFAARVRSLLNVKAFRECHRPEPQAAAA